jgi:hypothetical protein
MHQQSVLRGGASPAERPRHLTYADGSDGASDERGWIERRGFTGSETKLWPGRLARRHLSIPFDFTSARFTIPADRIHGLKID